MNPGLLSGLPTCYKPARLRSIHYGASPDSADRFFIYARAPVDDDSAEAPLRVRLLLVQHAATEPGMTTSNSRALLVVCRHQGACSRLIQPPRARQDTVLDSHASLSCLQSPGRPFEADTAKTPPCARIVLVRHAATEQTEAGVLMGTQDRACSSLGQVQAHKAGEFLMDMRVRELRVSPLDRAQYTGGVIAACQSVAWGEALGVLVVPELSAFHFGSLEGTTVSQV